MHVASEGVHRVLILPTVRVGRGDRWGSRNESCVEQIDAIHEGVEDRVTIGAAPDEADVGEALHEEVVEGRVHEPAVGLIDCLEAHLNVCGGGDEVIDQERVVPPDLRDTSASPPTFSPVSRKRRNADRVRKARIWRMSVSPNPTPPPSSTIRMKVSSPFAGSTAIP